MFCDANGPLKVLYIYRGSGAEGAMCDAIEYEIMLHCLLQSKKEMEKLKVPLDIWIDSHEYTLNLKVTCVV